MLHKRKSYKQISALNLAILSLFMMIWFFGYMKPIFSSLFKESNLFYGTVSFIAVPSVFGNTNIPFLDKLIFNINNDKEASFYLYLSPQEKIDMTSWFSWWDTKNQAPIPLEIEAVRINKSTWVVKKLSTIDGSISEEILKNFHMRIAFWGFLFEIFLLYLSIKLLRLFLKEKKPNEE